MERKFCISYRYLNPLDYCIPSSVPTRAEMWPVGLGNHVWLIKYPGIPSSKIPWAKSSKVSQVIGQWEKQQEPQYLTPLMCTTWLSISPARQLRVLRVKSGDLKIVWGCGKTLKLDIYLRLLVCLPIGKPNYSEAWLKGSLENIFEAPSTWRIVLQGSLMFLNKCHSFI